MTSTTGLAEMIEDAKRTIAGWPPDVRRALGIPDEPGATQVAIERDELVRLRTFETAFREFWPLVDKTTISGAVISETEALLAGRPSTVNF